MAWTPRPGRRLRQEWSVRVTGVRTQTTRPLFAGGPDIGVLLGGTATYYRYGFRKVPYSSKWRVRLGYATGAQTLNGDVLGDIRLANSQTYFTLLVRGSGISTLNFYGYGNDTPETGPVSFYRVRQNEYTLQPGITFQATKRSTLSLYLRGMYSVTFDDTDRFIGTQDVLGTGDFGRSVRVPSTRGRAASPPRSPVPACRPRPAGQSSRRCGVCRAPLVNCTPWWTGRGTCTRGDSSRPWASGSGARRCSGTIRS